MTQISLSKALTIIDEERGKLLTKRNKLAELTAIAEAKFYHSAVEEYTIADGIYKAQLRLLNKLKKELSNLSDSDQLSLGC